MTDVDSLDVAQIRFIETASAFGAFRRNKYGAEEDVNVEEELDPREEESSSEEDEE